MVEYKVPKGYALVSEDLLRAWGKLEELEEMCTYPIGESITDAERLLFTCEFDGYTTVEKDRYDYAIDCMIENGRDEPNSEDELNGLRRLIDAAMIADKSREVSNVR